MSLEECKTEKKLNALDLDDPPQTVNRHKCNCFSLLNYGISETAQISHRCEYFKCSLVLVVMF